MDAPQAPAAPDPAATAAAQSKSNKETAVAQYGLNATNQITPQGTSTYKQIGTWADGTPRFEQTTALNAGEQSIYDTGVQTRQNVAGIGRDQSSRIAELLGTPVNLNNEATESRLYDLGSKRLDPRFAKESSALETDLINRGIRPGSEAYNNARTAFDQSKNDAYNQLLLSGRGQAVQEGLTERNQPINEITALLSNSQVSQPNFTNTPTPGVAPTDVIGAQQQSLNQQNLGYQGQLSQNNAMMSGLFGLGSAALGGWGYGGFKTSDVRAKENIKRVGQTDKGLPIYTYSYKGNGGLMEMGVMAQEIAEVNPDAVALQPDGLLSVDYAEVA